MSSNNNLLVISKSCLESFIILKQATQLKFSESIAFINIMTSFFSTKYHLKAELYSLASGCLKALTVLLFNQNNSVNKTVGLVYLYMALIKLFHYLQDTIDFEYEVLECPKINDQNEFSFAFITNKPISISNSKLEEITTEKPKVAIAKPSVSSVKSETINLVDSEKMHNESTNILKNLKEDLKYISGLIKFEKNATLAEMNNKKLNEMVLVVPRLRSNVSEWGKLFIYLSKLLKSENNEFVKTLSKETFEVSINLLRYMLCAHLSLKLIISDKPLKDFEYDIEHIKKYLSYLSGDSTEIVSLFKKLGIHIQMLIENKSTENKKIKIDLNDIFSSKEAEKSLLINEKEKRAPTNEPMNEENWFEKITNITATSQTSTTEDKSKILNKKRTTEKAHNQKNPNPEKKSKSKSINSNQNISKFGKDNMPELSFQIPENEVSTITTDVEVDLEISKALIKRQLKNANISEIYKNAGATKYQANAIDIFDPELYNVEKKEKWTYEKLIESESLKKFISSIVKQLKEKIELNFKNNYQYEFEWCILVDNSGSMSSKETYVAETIVVLIEVLRRLEHKFAVARFGNKNDKKALLKDFKTPMSISLGQQILESFTYDQGTYPIEALQNISQKIWPKDKAQNEQRIVLMITDGLTTQKESGPWINLKSQKSFKLGIVVIKEKSQAFYSEQLLKEITEKKSNNESCFRVLNSDDSNKLAFEFLYVMIYIFDEIMKAASSIGQTNSKEQSTLLNRIEIPTEPSLNNTNQFDEHLDALLKSVGELNYEYAVKNGHSKPNLMFSVNSDNDTFKDVNIENNDSKIDLKKKIDELEHYYLNSFSNDEIRARLVKLEERWNALEAKLFKQISDYTDVLQTTVFPSNKYTRKKANTKGSNLYLPGLVKAVITDFNYKKIFSTKTAGGKKVYSIVLVIDISYSMNGHMADCVIDVLICLISSLQKIGIENFSIILFGKNVKIIKLENQAWDSRVMYALFDNLRFDSNYATNDADAIETAIAILQNSSANGIKKIFVFTDGFSSCKSNLMNALKKADSLSIETIGVAVGFEKPFIQSSYKMYIHVALPFAFHQALQALYENSDEGIGVKDDEKFHEAEIDDVNEILKGLDSNKVFDKYLKDLKVEREAKLVRGDCNVQEFPVDICFCLDCTGSMAPWIDAAKSQMTSIVKNIKVKIEKDYPSIKLAFKIGVLAFRDFSEGSKQFEELMFTEKTEEFETFLKNLIAFGGEDIPEDVLGALDRVVTHPNWVNSWNSKVKFLILITDSPSHGTEFTNNQLTDTYPNGSPNVPPVKTVMQKIRQMNIEFIFASILDQTKTMETKFSAEYNSKEDNKTMSVIRLIDAKAIKDSQVRKHYIFLLDESGSMSGTPWNELTAAYNNFINLKEKSQSIVDFVSVIKYDDTVTRVCTRVSVENAKNKLGACRSGGTYFQPSFVEAEKIISSETVAQPIIIFMSDGCASDNPLDFIKTSLMTESNKLKGLKIHTIAFGSADTAVLNNIASAGGTGSAKTASNGVQLATAFTKIATDESKVLNEMVNMFAEYVGKEISTKLVLEYL